MASLAIGRVMAGAPGRGTLELLVEVTPYLQVRQPERVRGWSISPLFIRWNFPPVARARIFGEVSGSTVLTAAPVVAGAATFNFVDQAWIRRALRRKPEAGVARGLPLAAHVEWRAG